jgi:hypothetical protein
MPRFRSTIARSLALLAVAAGVAAPARADFHFILIVEVFVGSAVAPDAQYVVLQMYSSGQTNLGSHPMRFFDAAGASLGTASFGTISNGDDNAKILIATSTAEALFGITADLRVPVNMPAAGGKVCFDDVDCFAWGNYSGSSIGVGTPFADFGPNLCARRAFDPPLSSADDTNDSDDDFIPDPDVSLQNNAGELGAGIVPESAIFLDGFEDSSYFGWTLIVNSGD